MSVPRGRPPIPEQEALAEAIAFFELVEQQRQAGAKLTTAFHNVRRRDPKRWGSERKMWRLWKLSFLLH